MLVLPFEPSIGAYEFSCSIDDDLYIFRPRWNANSKAWYFDVLEQDETPIAYGLKIVLGVYIGKTINHRLFRTGVLIAVDTSRKGVEATFDDLGTRVELRWFPLDEWFLRLAAGRWLS